MSLVFDDGHFNQRCENDSSSFNKHMPQQQTSPMGRTKYFQGSHDDAANNAVIIEHLLQTRENDFLVYEPLRIFVGSYNVNGQNPSGSLLPWLAETVDAPDIYFIGMQELDLSQQAFLFDVSAKESVWSETVAKSLHKKYSYVELKRVRLVGIFLIVYIRKELLEKFYHSDISTVGTGLLGYMGNKGGVGVSFRLMDSWICVINSHLAAHNDELERRNQDFREILSRTKFHTLNEKVGEMTIIDHDLVFWFGDLNYRLQTEDGENLDVSFVKQLCHTGDFDELLKFDQLRNVQSRNDAFHQFTEGKIMFIPTYKYDPGSNLWDTSEKCRCPAWCDRILWRLEDKVQLQTYRSIPQLKISDHKPVCAEFITMVKRIDPVRYKKVFQEAIREADRIENEYLPQVTIDTLEITFDNVKFMEPQVKSLTITNVGQGDVVFSFRNKPQQDSPSHDWLNLRPNGSQYLPKGQSFQIEFQVLVDREVAWQINAGLKLYDILVLHLEKGKDFFITLFANYSPSCFGESISNLMKPESTIVVENVPTATLIDLGFETVPNGASAVSSDPDSKNVAPVIVALVEHIRRNCIDSPELFLNPGRASEFGAIRDALDEGRLTNIPGSDASVAEALCTLLNSFPEPVIPYDFYSRCCSAACNHAASKQIIEQLPVHHKVLFRYLIRFLRDLLRHFSTNNTDISLLAGTFAPLILKPHRSPTKAISATTQQQQRQIANQFMMNFLLHGV